MCRKTNQVLCTILTVLTILTTSCVSKTNSTKINNDVNKANPAKKSDYELAYEFLIELKKQNVDTIIFYMRTCLSCCDFFNMFWSDKNGKHLAKFYFDFDDMQTHSKIVHLKNDKIFETLYQNYSELKITKIKENSHKQENGETSKFLVNHYCYTEINIYTKLDSIISNRMLDHDFDKYTDFGLKLPDANKGRETNDSYAENMNSKWNLILTTIENELEVMPQTINREKETLRKNRTK